tara:strand:- start:7579 stop:8241 length:663 start_codon:yes stop_codon:yes gene_type:complete
MLRQLIKLCNDLDEKGMHEEADRLDSIMLDPEFKEQVDLHNRVEKYKNFMDKMREPRSIQSDLPDYSFRSVLRDIGKELPVLIRILPDSFKVFDVTEHFSVDGSNIINYWSSYLRRQDDPAALVRELDRAFKAYDREAHLRLIGLDKGSSLSKYELSELYRDISYTISEEELEEYVAEYMPDLPEAEVKRRVDHFVHEAGDLKWAIEKLRDLFTRKRRYR